MLHCLLYLRTMLYSFSCLLVPSFAHKISCLRLFLLMTCFALKRTLGCVLACTCTYYCTTFSFVLLLPECHLDSHTSLFLAILYLNFGKSGLFRDFNLGVTYRPIDGQTDGPTDIWKNQISKSDKACQRSL